VQKRFVGFDDFMKFSVTVRLPTYEENCVPHKRKWYIIEINFNNEKWCVRGVYYNDFKRLNKELTSLGVKASKFPFPYPKFLLNLEKRTKALNDWLEAVCHKRQKLTLNDPLLKFLLFDKNINKPGVNSLIRGIMEKTICLFN
jgi:hypothetical protein